MGCVSSKGEQQPGPSEVVTANHAAVAELAACIGSKAAAAAAPEASTDTGKHHHEQRCVQAAAHADNTPARDATVEADQHQHQQQQEQQQQQEAAGQQAEPAQPATSAMTVIRKAKAVMQELHAICGENSWATCCQAAQVLQQQLMGVTAVSIAAQTGSPGTCILAGAYGPGAEWQQQQVFMSGAHWSACACLQLGKPHLYRTGSPEAAATAAADEVWPQDWAYLHKEHGLSTFLAVRIADAHGRPLGVLCLASTATDAYQEEWWEPLLSMVCTSLASLLKSPVMAGLAELAGCLVDTREEFSTLAKAFIQGSAALVEAVTNVRVEVKLGLLSPDAQHVLMLYMTHQEPSGT